MKSSILITIISLFMLYGCRSQREVTSIPAPEQVQAPTTYLDSAPVQSLPHAVIYKTNGDYADNVAVNLTDNGKTLLSYPAVTDVSAQSSALPVANGWLLDRRGGVGKNTAFLNITYSQYSKLPQTPSPAELMKMILPDAKVMMVRTLPCTASEAIANPSIVEQYCK